MMAGDGRQSAGQRAALGWHVSHRHLQMGEAKSGAGDPGVGEEICIQCGKCVMVCPHAVIRAKVCDPALLAGAPERFRSTVARWKDREQMRYMLQVAPEDCTGCGLCVEVCPAKSKSEAKKKAINMAPQAPHSRPGTAQLGFLPEPSGSRPRQRSRLHNVKDVQLLRAAVRVSGRLRRLRRDALHQDAHAAVRRSRGDRQCHGLFVHLRRQSAHYALHRESRRPRSGLVEFAVRRQRRVRFRHARLARQAGRVRARAVAKVRVEDRRGAGAVDSDCGSIQ